jgi:Fe-coproporphyrin III synthase
MLKKLNYIYYGITYLLKTVIFGRDIPFIGGMVINDRCNLSCRQCRVGDRSGDDLSYQEMKNGLLEFYKSGIRSVFIEGGEPFLWKDGPYRVEDIVNLSRRIGFKTISIYTNGTFHLQTKADVLFVSLDGLQKTNDYLRGNVFDRVISNIKDSSHPNININFTINAANQNELEPFCEYIRNIRQINGVFFYFHTPYYGTDELFLNFAQRQKLILDILKLKRRGFRILNSTACLKMVHDDTWQRPSKLCHVYAKNKMFQCCRAVENTEVCKNCGYLGYPEIISILKLRPSSLISAMNYLPRNV